MSNYPQWWDATITIYNKYTDSVTKVVTWYRTVITNCFWKNIGSKVNVGDIVLDTESIVCRIPENSKFLDAYKWINTPNDRMNKYFTLKQGDIIVFGNCSFSINEYASGHRSTDLIAKYRQLQGCMEIKDVAINTMTGMVFPHYRVRGL